MGKQILKTNIKREKGKLYYCSTDNQGNLVVCEAEMSRKGPGKKKVTKKKAVKKATKKPTKKKTAKKK